MCIGPCPCDVHQELDTHHKCVDEHKQSTPRAGEGLLAGAARLGRAALQNQLLDLQDALAYCMKDESARSARVKQVRHSAAKPVWQSVRQVTPSASLRWNSRCTAHRRYTCRSRASANDPRQRANRSQAAAQRVELRAWMTSGLRPATAARTSRRMAGCARDTNPRHKPATSSNVELLI